MGGSTGGGACTAAGARPTGLHGTALFVALVAECEATASTGKHGGSKLPWAAVASVAAWLALADDIMDADTKRRNAHKGRTLEDFGSAITDLRWPAVQRPLLMGGGEAGGGGRATHTGNAFEIRLRGFDSEQARAGFVAAFAGRGATTFPNYYGQQRLQSASLQAALAKAASHCKGDGADPAALGRDYATCFAVCSVVQAHLFNTGLKAAHDQAEASLDAKVDGTEAGTGASVGGRSGGDGDGDHGEHVAEGGGAGGGGGGAAAGSRPLPGLRQLPATLPMLAPDKPTANWVGAEVCRDAIYAEAHRLGIEPWVHGTAPAAPNGACKGATRPCIAEAAGLRVRASTHTHLHSSPPNGGAFPLLLPTPPHIAKCPHGAWAAKRPKSIPSVMYRG